MIIILEIIIFLYFLSPIPKHCSIAAAIAISVLPDPAFPIKVTRGTLSSNNKSLPCKRILTGHTATDLAETIIMNLARGTDLIGLSTLTEKRTLENNLELVRPLLIFNREETLEICKEFNLPIWIDPSNENMDLTRNRIRKEILPILNSIYKGAD